ncbi:MAG: hypothetical protein ACXU85_14745 [Xanthobacteraceae bacterium]
MTGAIVSARTLLLERGEALLVGRIFDDAEDRAVLGRSKPKGMVGDLAITAVVGGHGPRLPEFGDDGTAGPAVVDVWRRRVLNENRTATRRIPLGMDVSDEPLSQHFPAKREPGRRRKRLNAIS